VNKGAQLPPPPVTATAAPPPPGVCGPWAGARCRAVATLLLGATPPPLRWAGGAWPRYLLLGPAPLGRRSVQRGCRLAPRCCASGSLRPGACGCVARPGVGCSLACAASWGLVAGRRPPAWGVGFLSPIWAVGCPPLAAFLVAGRALRRRRCSAMEREWVEVKAKGLLAD
jgi:hypothetical protein